MKAARCTLAYLLVRPRSYTIGCGRALLSPTAERLHWGLTHRSI